MCLCVLCVCVYIYVYTFFFNRTKSHEKEKEVNMSTTKPDIGNSVQPSQKAKYNELHNSYGKRQYNSSSKERNFPLILNPKKSISCGDATQSIFGIDPPRLWRCDFFRMTAERPTHGSLAMMGLQQPSTIWAWPRNPEPHPETEEWLHILFLLAACPSLSWTSPPCSRATPGGVGGHKYSHHSLVGKQGFPNPWWKPHHQLGSTGNQEWYHVSQFHGSSWEHVC